MLEELGVVLAFLALDRLRGAWAAASAPLVEEILGRLTGDDSIRDGVGMTLVGVASCADAALEVDTSALLNNMRGFVRHDVEVGAAPRGRRDCRSRMHRRPWRSRTRRLGGAGVSLDR